MREHIGTIIVVALICMTFLVAMGLYGEWAYDDWTCAFKECRVIKDG